MAEAAIVRKEPTAIEAAAGDAYTMQQVALIKAQIMPAASDAELALFLEYARRTGLDPFARQIYAIARKDTKTGKTVGYDFTTGIDGLRLVAERTGEYQGQDVAWCGPDGEWVDVWIPDTPPAAAKVTVHRLGRRPVSRVCRYEEFVQRGRDGKVRYGNWTTRPAHQLAIRAESHALRAAFPRELQGIAVDYEDVRVMRPDAPISNPQKGELMRLARVFGWTDDERRARAGVASFRDLTKGEAAVLIDEWRAFEARMHETGEVPPDGDDVAEGELVEDEGTPTPRSPSSDEQAGEDDSPGTPAASGSSTSRRPATTSRATAPGAARGKAAAKDPADAREGKPSAGSRSPNTISPHTFVGDPDGICQAKGFGPEPCGMYLEAPVHHGQAVLA